MSAPLEITLHTPVKQLPGVRASNATALAALGVHNLGQLAAYLPMRHEAHQAETSIAEIRPGTIVTTRGEVTATRSVAGRSGKKSRFEAVLHDGTGRLDLVWFNAPYMRRTLHPGVRLSVHGDVRAFGSGIQVANPKYSILDDAKPEPIAAEARVRSVYPASEHISSNVIEEVIRATLPLALPLIDDHLLPEHRRKRELPELREAYRMIHLPETEAEAAGGRRRLAYDELLLLQLGVHMKRAHLRGTLRSPALAWSATIDQHIRARFPFALTPDQNRVLKEVTADLTKDTPTNRLIQGDVGSGKTIVALYAMLLAAASRHQAALMAPTELLAEQHFASISGMLGGSKVRVRLLTGSMSTRDRAVLLRELERGEIDLLIGTHAVISGGVKFHSLAVAVIDEQHRFGVHQRAALRSKGDATVGKAGIGVPPTEPETAGSISEPPHGPHPHAAPLTPHVLVMTATPIPRTLALTLFGDLDVSTIRTLPPGRKPVRTRVLTPDRTDLVYQFVRRRIDAGDQVYIVVPTIDSDALLASSTGVETSIASVESVMARLTSPGGALSGVRVAAMHGRLTQEERDATMRDFRDGRIRALVATTVIEVGVDVPTANVMVIEQAERFGLSQLHQLRGRVGRGRKQSVCLLIGDAVTEVAGQRLAVMRRVNDGFVLAERDFEIRGPGEVFGLRQSGVAPFKVADLMNDRDLLQLATRDAAAWIARSPALARPDESLVRRRLFKAHGPWIGIGDVG